MISSSYTYYTEPSNIFEVQSALFKYKYNSQNYLQFSIAQQVLNCSGNCFILVLLITAVLTVFAPLLTLRQSIKETILQKPINNVMFNYLLIPSIKTNNICFKIKFNLLKT